MKRKKLVREIIRSAKGKIRDVKRLRKLGCSESEIAKALGISELELSLI